MTPTVRTAWFAALLLLLLDRVVPAQVTLTHTDEQGAMLYSARAWASGGCDEGLGIGFVRVDLHNLDRGAHDFGVGVSSRRWDGGEVKARQRLTLQGGEQRRLFLPMPVPPIHLLLTLDVDGKLQEAVLECARGRGLVALLVSERPEMAPLSLGAVQALPSRWPLGRANPPEQVVASGREVPADWRMFTAFAAVVVDGGAELDAEHQLALCRYAAAGGTLVVAGADRLAAGALRELAARDVGAHGMGQIVGVPAFGGDTTAMRTRLSALPTVGSTLPAPFVLLGAQDIAGLGKAPVAAFVLVILLFAILVGPVNFLVLRRRRQPMLALLTVPLLGFGTTLLILTYGVFHDGFGVRGVVTSITVLDQPRRECTVYAARTLFAGLAPDDLTMGEQTMLLSPGACYGNSDVSDSWNLDVGSERLDGAVLPSRTPTPLLSVQQGTARQRLSLQLVGDDRLQVLAGGGVEPTGELVLRDLDGRWWRGTGATLAPVGDAVGRAAMDNLLAGLRPFEIEQDGRGGRGRVVQADPGSLPRPAHLGEPGSYVTEVGRAPWLDEHGLTIDYDAQRHFVFGRLHAEDFVR